MDRIDKIMQHAHWYIGRLDYPGLKNWKIHRKGSDTLFKVSDVIDQYYEIEFLEAKN